MISKGRKLVGTGLLATATTLFGINTTGFVAGEGLYWKADPELDLQRTHTPVIGSKALDRGNGEPGGLSKQLAAKYEQDRYLRWMYLFKWLISTVLFLLGIWTVRRSRRLTKLLRDRWGIG